MNLLFAIPNVSVPNAAALSALTNLTDLIDGAEVYVSTYRCPFYLMTSAAGLLPNEILSSTDGARRWFRKPVAHLSWALTGTYNVNATTGSDENDGSALAPLQTFGEYIRRVPIIYIPQTVNVLTTLPDSDNLVYIPQVQWHQSLSASFPGLVITGTRTLGANNAVITSADETGNAAPLIDLGIALTPGTIIQATSGARINATTVVVALIAGTQYRTAPWQSAAIARVAPPAPGNTVAVVTLPTINRFQICGENLGSIQVINLNVKALQTTGSASHNVIWDTCTFGGAQNIVMSTGCAQLFRGSAISTTGLFSNVTAGSSMQMRQCGVIRPNDTMAFGGLSRVEFSNVVIQNGIIDVGQPGVVGAGLCQIFASSLGVFGIAASKSLLVRRSGAMSIEGTLYGPDPGGGSVGTDVNTGGRLLVKSTVTPTLTGATELSFDGNANANPGINIATGVIPAGAPLNNWGAGAGGWSNPATFNRNVMSYITAGTGINNYV